MLGRALVDRLGCRVAGGRKIQRRTPAKDDLGRRAKKRPPFKKGGMDTPLRGTTILCGATRQSHPASISMPPRYARPPFRGMGDGLYTASSSPLSMAELVQI